MGSSNKSMYIQVRINETELDAVWWGRGTKREEALNPGNYSALFAVSTGRASLPALHPD